MSESAEPDEVTPRDADLVVRQKRNRVYNPVHFTSEVAEELGVSEETAYELLSEAPRPDEKKVDGVSVWW